MSVQERFNALDLNGDGQISKAEFVEFERLRREEEKKQRNTIRILKAASEAMRRDDKECLRRGRKVDTEELPIIEEDNTIRRSLKKAKTTD